MMLQDNEIDLINRAVDSELGENEQPLFAKLIRDNDEARNLHAELSALDSLIKQIPVDEPPWDIAQAVNNKLRSKVTRPQIPAARSFVWAIAASLVVAVGILSLDIEIGKQGDLVGTLAQPDGQLSRLVYLDQGQGWAVAIEIDVEADFRLLLDGMGANWQFETGDRDNDRDSDKGGQQIASVGLQIRNVGSQTEIRGRGPISIKLPLLPNKNSKPASSPELIGELEFEGRVYQGHLDLRKNQ